MYIHHLTSIGNCISRLMQLRIRTHQVIFSLYISVLLLLLLLLYEISHTEHPLVTIICT